jgi:hypothetical protein
MAILTKKAKIIKSVHRNVTEDQTFSEQKTRLFREQLRMFCNYFAFLCVEKVSEHLSYFLAPINTVQLTRKNLRNVKKRQREEK